MPLYIGELSDILQVFITHVDGSKDLVEYEPVRLNDTQIVLAVLFTDEVQQGDQLSIKINNIQKLLPGIVNKIEGLSLA